ncbi:MAG: prepilin-type N-terminal cleavage/methylation domain-containing protein [Desulfobacterales bacterium]|nr:MAG: prepilin-type N-terminal cleavage/methylation domain-containing protein [Desulfobacterales bacterium]
MDPKSLKDIFSKFKRMPNPGATEPWGFTLVELMVALAVSLIVLVAVVSLFTTYNSSYTKQNVAADVQQVVRAGVDFMAQSIRMAGLDAAGTGNFGISVATSSSITFSADFDLSGGIPGPAETISYFLNGDELQSSLDAIPLVENLDIANGPGLTFTYLDESGSDLGNPVPASNLDDIRTVVISITVREPAGKNQTVARTYSTEVKCRNLGL